MAEVRMQGWGGLVVMVVVVALAAFRFAGLDEIDDPELVAQVKADLEGQARNALFEDTQESGDSSARFLATRIDVIELTGSAPLLDFDSSKDYVLRVTFRIADDEGSTRERTRYLHARRQSDSWQLLTGEATQVGYYLNFY